jgi:hypothetical protein
MFAQAAMTRPRLDDQDDTFQASSLARFMDRWLEVLTADVDEVDPRSMNADKQSFKSTASAGSVVEADQEEQEVMMRTLQSLGLSCSIASWSIADTSNWLSAGRYKSYASKTTAAEYAGPRLLSCSVEDLVGLGMMRSSAMKLHQQVQVLVAINSNAKPMPSREGAMLAGPWYGCTKNVTNWDVASVLSWLKAANRTTTVELFGNLSVNGATLLQLDESQLENMDVPPGPERRKLANDIASIQEELESKMRKESVSPSKRLSPAYLDLATELSYLLWSRWRSMPYRVCFLFKTLFEGLQSKCPGTARQELLSSLSHLVIKLYLEPACLELVKQAGLSTRQEENVTVELKKAFALLLQAAKGIPAVPKDSSPLHQRQCQRYFTRCIPQVRQVAKRLLGTASLEDYLGVDEYASVAAMSAPVVYISLADLLNVHDLLVKQLGTMAPASQAVLRPILEAFASIRDGSHTPTGAAPSVIAAVDANNEAALQTLQAWTIKDVGYWLEDLNMDQYSMVFEDNKVDGRRLITVKSGADFEQLGVSDYRDAMTLYRSFGALKAKLAASAAASTAAMEAMNAQAAASASSKSPQASKGSLTRLFRRSSRRKSSADASAKPLEDGSLADWNAGDVARWLESAGFGKYQADFATHNVDGRHLDKVTSGESFSALGVTDYKDTIGLYKALMSARTNAKTDGMLSASSVNGNGSTTAAASTELYIPTPSDLGIDSRKLKQPLAIEVVFSTVAEGLQSQQSEAEMGMASVFSRTKKMIIDVLRQLAGTTLPQVLSTPPTSAQELSHKAFTRAVQADASLNEGARRRVLSIAGASLRQLQTMTLANLTKLTEAGLTSPGDGYQSLLDGITQDIRSHAVLKRQHRRELVKLTSARQSLDAKLALLHARMQSYQSIVEQMQVDGSGSLPGLSQVQAASRPTKPSNKPRKLLASKSFGTHRLSGSKLKAKRVLVKLTAPNAVDAKDLILELSSYEEGVLRMAALVAPSRWERLQTSLDELRQAKAAGNVQFTKLDGIILNMNALIMLVDKLLPAS